MPLHSTSGRLRAAAIALVAAAALGLFASPAPGQDVTNEDLKVEFDEVLGQEAELLQQLADAQAARQTAGDKLATLERDTQTKQLELLGAQDRLAQAEADLTDRVAEREEAEAKAADARERLRDQIVAAYVTGGDDGGVLAAFLNADNGEQVGQALAYGHAVSSTTEVLVDELDAAEAASTKAAREARLAKTEATSARDEIADAAAFLVTARAEQQALVDDLNLTVLLEATALRNVQGRKAVVEGRINAMSRASDGVAMILASLQEGEPDWVPGSVQITSPIPGVLPSSGYGMRHHPILGIDRLHAGVDLGAPSGTTIYAPADGIVVLAEVRGGYGNTVVLAHGNALGTLYGHTSKMLVSLGDTVKRGDPIALVGSTGLSTGPHLHFETRVRGLPIDPEQVIDFAAPVLDYGPDVTTTTKGN